MGRPNREFVIEVGQESLYSGASVEPADAAITPPFALFPVSLRDG